MNRGEQVEKDSPSGITSSKVCEVKSLTNFFILSFSKFILDDEISRAKHLKVCVQAMMPSVAPAARQYCLHVVIC